jgi:glycogen synthase
MSKDTAMDITVFEVSNEVANKVGGIYAVLASKSAHMMKSFSDYYAVGPYDAKGLPPDFEYVGEHPFHKSFEELAKQGIKCVFGHWIKGSGANCILVDASGISNQKNAIKTMLWEKHHVDSLVSGQLFDDSLVWGEAVGRVIETLLKTKGLEKRKVIIQCHEWLSGATLLHMRSCKLKAGLVFTTHATTMGRSMAERGEDLIKIVSEGVKKKEGMSDEKAKAYGIQAIHSLEKACAHTADVFTTVSQVTGDEATYILGRKPDVLTLNGLNIDSYPSMEELSISHKKYRRRMKHFVLGLFSPYYNLDIDNSLYFFTAGRYEYHNKGYDILIEAMARLNERLRGEKSEKTAVVFLWVPAETSGGNLEVLDNLSMFDSIEDEIEMNLRDIREHIIESVCHGELPTKTKIFDDSFLYDLKQKIVKMRAKRDKNPPINVLELSNKEDTILKTLLEKGLDNKEDDRVKAIYYPAYLSSADGLLGLNYNDAIMACHLGLFPSYYEPWGYTPIETAALAVPSVTTDAAGFGKFIESHSKGTKPAIKVLKRKPDGDEETIEQLVDYMYFILNSSRKERVKKKIEAKQLSELVDWKKLIKNYESAYEMAMKRVKSSA